MGSVPSVGIFLLAASVWIQNSTLLCDHCIAMTKIIPKTYVDEVIRQVAINSPDRGLLLLRVRDEIRMTLAGYQALYENAVWFGRSNADEGYENKEELLKHYRDIENKVLEARAEVEEMRLEVDATRRTLKERREMDAKRHAEEVQFIKRANQQIKVTPQNISLKQFYNFHQLFCLCSKKPSRLSSTARDRLQCLTNVSCFSQKIVRTFA